VGSKRKQSVNQRSSETGNRKLQNNNSQVPGKPGKDPAGSKDILKNRSMPEITLKGKTNKKKESIKNKTNQSKIKRKN